MYEILNASEDMVDYTDRSLVYFEISGNELYPVASRIGLAGGREENSLISVAKRARSGESNLVAISGDKHGNIAVYRIDDIDALLMGYGLGEDNGHRHQICWEYNPRDDGKSLYAKIDLTFTCGCHINVGNIRTRANELQKQHRLTLKKTAFSSLIDSSHACMEIMRKDIRDRNKELK